MLKTHASKAKNAASIIPAAKEGVRVNNPPPIEVGA